MSYLRHCLGVQEWTTDEDGAETERPMKTKTTRAAIKARHKEMSDLYPV